MFQSFPANMNFYYFPTCALDYGYSNTTLPQRGFESLKMPEQTVIHSSSPESIEFKAEEDCSDQTFCKSKVKSEAEEGFQHNSVPIIQKKEEFDDEGGSFTKEEYLKSQEGGEPLKFALKYQSISCLDCSNKPSYSRIHLDFENALRNEIEKMVRFILTNMGKGSDSTFENQSKVYLHHPSLLNVYNSLIKKYCSAKKVKEELVRYIMRKALKTMKKSLLDSTQLRGKKASQVLCQRYFSQQISSPEMLDKNEDELIEHFLPYRDNSKNKTINMKFVSEVFSSDKFLHDYLENFLPELPNLLIEDNIKKINKLVDFLMICVKENNFAKLTFLKVFPWLDIWLEETQNLAIAIVPPNKMTPKKTKFEAI